MLVQDLLWRMSGVMVFSLSMLDSDGCYVMDDKIDYLRQTIAETEVKSDLYAHWYVEEIIPVSAIHVQLVICPTEREEFNNENRNESV